MKVQLITLALQPLWDWVDTYTYQQLRISVLIQLTITCTGQDMVSDGKHTAFISFLCSLRSILTSLRANTTQHKLKFSLNKIKLQGMNRTSKILRIIEKFPLFQDLAMQKEGFINFNL